MPAAAQLRRWTGTYQDTVSGEVRRVLMRGDALVLDAGGREWPLAPIGEAEFRVDAGVELTFRFEPGPPVRLRQMLQGQATTFHPIETVSPDAAGLRAYTGRYRSVELDATFEVRLVDDALQLALPGSPRPRTLLPLQADAFDGGSVRLRFQRAGERVTGFLLDQGRVRGLTFERLAQ